MNDVTPESSDERLIDATLAGDDKAFAHLVARHKRRVFRLAFRFARDSDDLEDICQDVFIKVYDRLGTFRRDSPFEHWLARVAVRTCHDALRSRRHERHFQPLDDIAHELEDGAETSRNATRQARDLLKWALGFLSPAERLVITLMELEEMTLRETAELTGWSETNVKVRAHRARLALRKVLEKNDAG